MKLFLNIEENKSFPPIKPKKNPPTGFFLPQIIKDLFFFVPALCNICLLSKTSQKKKLQDG